jgi:cytochrome c biogenesis protein CcmG/thiol:disulfide interchange protein DsbE
MSRTPLRKLLVWAGGVAVVVALLVYGLAGIGGPNGRVAPALPREQLAGKAVTLAELRGHPVLVTFWASWCEPCEHEASALERFSQGLGARATLVGVNWGDLSLAGARSFIKRFVWTFPNLRDPGETVGHAYGVTVLPTTFVIDGEGRVRAMLRGPQTQQSLGTALAAVGG